jgi:hypothetical protein
MDDLFSIQELTENSSIVLARARAGHTVRLYDPEGYDFSLCSTRQLEELRQLAEISATLLLLLRARGQVPGEAIPLADYGLWPWLRHLDGETLDLFLAEVVPATAAAAREQAVAPLQDLLSRWRGEAEASR